MLAPLPDHLASTARPPMTGAALVQEIKKELKRVGCYGGHLDDKWASGDTRASVARFVKFANLSSAPDEPVLEFLEALRSKAERVCPTECSARQVVVDGRCVTKTCPAGSVLNAAGECDKQAERQRTAVRPPARESTRDDNEKPARSTIRPARESTRVSDPSVNPAPHQRSANPCRPTGGRGFGGRGYGGYRCSDY
jgi:hypothetical protein